MIQVLAKDVRAAVPGDCFRCAVALALQRATGDDHANVYEDDYQLRLEVWSRSIIAPWEVTQFVHALDDLPRTRTGRAKLPRKLDGDLTPPTFELPAADDPEWDERCPGCEQYIKADEQDDEGYCAECQAKAVTT
jgi:hypothetical protein